MRPERVKLAILSQTPTVFDLSLLRRARLLPTSSDGGSPSSAGPSVVTHRWATKANNLTCKKRNHARPWPKALLFSAVTLGTLGFYFPDTLVPRLEFPLATLWLRVMEHFPPTLNRQRFGT